MQVKMSVTINFCYLLFKNKPYGFLILPIIEFIIYNYTIIQSYHDKQNDKIETD